MADHSGCTSVLQAVKGGSITIGSEDDPAVLLLGRMTYREYTVNGVIHATNWSFNAILSKLGMGISGSGNGGIGVGSMTLDSDDNVKIINKLFVGGYETGAGEGYLTVKDGKALQLGTGPSDRIDLLAIGYRSGTYGSSKGIFSVTGGVCKIWAKNIYVGYTEGGGNGVGVMRLGPSNEIYAITNIIGRGHGGNGRGYGWLEAVSNGYVKLGDSNNPVVDMYIGWKAGDQLGTGFVNAATWKLDANISRLTVGHCPYYYGGYAGGNGILTLDGDDIMNVATLRLATVVNYTKAWVTLLGGRIGVSNVLSIGQDGTVTNYLTGFSGGIDFGGDSITLNGKYHIVFGQPKKQGIYWGFRWRGNHTNELNSLYSAGKISWDSSKLSPEWAEQVAIRYYPQDNYSYIGFKFWAKGTVFCLR